MPRGHCQEGGKLYVLYKKRAMELLGLETYKRHTICAASRSEWLEISRCVETARTTYEEARSKYVDHKIACEQCDHDVATFCFLKASGEKGPATPGKSATAADRFRPPSHHVRIEESISHGVDCNWGQKERGQ
jgi:hypothetical protein